MTIVILLVLAIVFIILFVEKASREDKLISKYLLTDWEKPKIRATLKATPDNPCKDEWEWFEYIYTVRNSPTN